jgi:hypothetical protein
MLMDMEIDKDLVSIEMEVASGDPIVSQMEAGDYWEDLSAREGFVLHVESTIRTLKTGVSRNV